MHKIAIAMLFVCVTTARPAGAAPALLTANGRGLLRNLAIAAF